MQILPTEEDVQINQFKPESQIDYYTLQPI
jgi:hypothetical protein